MKKQFSFTISLFFVLSLTLFSQCFRIEKKEATTTACAPRTVRVAQSGQADVVGSDNVALQRAADMLHPGDKLVIGPGTYRMENSLVIPCSGVTVSGTPGETVLLKGPGAASKVVDGGDWGESELVLAEPGRFRPGMGISLRDDANSGGYDVSTATITAVKGDTLLLDGMAINDYDYETGNARVDNNFPILSAFGVRDVVIDGITADGNKAENPHMLDGCRGGAIYLFRCRNCVIRNCVARNYNGDGISFQITDSVKVINCESYGNTSFGAHPGTGSPRAEIRNCRLHHNDIVGLFLCWRARYGVFADNVIENNGRYGISIGHKDTDNLFENNTIRNNGFCGIFFRNESERLSGHRNIFQNNTIENNGDAQQGYGVYVKPKARDMVFENNTISETRTGKEATQRYGFYLVRGSGPVKIEKNTMSGHAKGDVFDENKTGAK
jgi:parallel beta-helix repeat protein